MHAGFMQQSATYIHTGEVAEIMSFPHQKYLPWWCKKAAPKLAAASLSLDVEVTF